MKGFASALLMIGMALSAQGQNLSARFTGVWLQKQQLASSKQWLFSGTEISTITSWANGTPIGGSVLKGSFRVDEQKQQLIIHYTSRFDIAGATVTAVDQEERWNITGAGKDEILLTPEGKQSGKESAPIHLKSFIKPDTSSTITQAG